MKRVTLICVALLCSVVRADDHPCAADARTQAPKLLAFHFGPDERIAVDTSVKVLSPIRNPANKSQSLEVLEIWGSIYKGRYRMRFLFGRLGAGECVLVGQEILEHTKL